MLDHHGALVYVMVLVSASDSEITDAELDVLSECIRYLPVFRDFDTDRLARLTRDCTALLADPEGIDMALDQIAAALPVKLRETAYAIACDVAAADAYVTQEELRFLELLRERLEIDRLNAVAIERGARARHTVL